MIGNVGDGVLQFLGSTSDLTAVSLGGGSGPKPHMLSQESGWGFARFCRFPRPMLEGRQPHAGTTRSVLSHRSQRAVCTRDSESHGRRFVDAEGSSRIGER